MDTDKDFIDLLFEEMEFSEIILYSFIMLCIIWFFTKVKVNFSQVSAIIAGGLIAIDDNKSSTKSSKQVILFCF